METVLPLSAQGLERAITGPAERVGITFESGLVAQIVSEMTYQSGALPLLQYALTELFERREGRLMTHAAYREIVKWVARKRGKQVVFVDRWERTTQKCSRCGHVQTRILKDRIFRCENDHCDLILDRDHNAAITIRKAGRCLLLSQSEEDLPEDSSGGIRR